MWHLLFEKNFLKDLVNDFKNDQYLNLKDLKELKDKCLHNNKKINKNGFFLFSTIISFPFSESFSNFSKKI